MAYDPDDTGVFGVVFAGFRQGERRSEGAGLAELLGMALLAYALAPVNSYANTYLIYAAAFAPFRLAGLLRPLALIFALLGVHALENFLLGQPRLVVAITVLVCTVCCIGNYFVAENARKSAALKASQEKVHRLAMVAERERIGRDLHDLLGHTLSLIALKSELAGKLLERNRDDAAREMTDVMQIAREALRQVRTAVTGIRSAALGSELSSARTLLESSGVKLTLQRDEALLPPEMETTVAMIVREAVTNIHRHAGATSVAIEVRTVPGTVANAPAGVDSGFTQGGSVILLIRDNGRGGVLAHGNGLAGIAERARCLGGTLEIDSPPGRGTLLRIHFPIKPDSGEVPLAMLADASEAART